MKTKKTAKIISSVLALVMLVCSLSAVSGFITSAENEENAEETRLVEALKTSWTKMYTNDYFATFNNNVNKNSGSITTNDSVPDNKPDYIGDDLLGFDITGNNIALFFSKNAASSEYTGLDKVFENYDNVTFSLYTGNVTTSGTIRLVLQDTGYNTIGSYDYTLTADESSNQWIDIDVLQSLECKNMEALLKQATEKGGTLSRMYLYIQNGLKAEGMVLGQVIGKTNATLPNTTTALELYNEANKITANDYINSDDFVAARTALGEYLRPQILKNELTTAWGTMYSSTEIGSAEHGYRNSELAMSASASSIPDDIKGEFTDNSFVFNKAACSVGSSFDINTSAFRYLKPDSNGNYDNYNFSNDAALFTDNDDIQFKFYTGNVTTAGKLTVRIFYTNWKKVDKIYTIDTSNQLITVSLKEIVTDKYNQKETLADCFDCTEEFADGKEHKVMNVCYQLSDELVGEDMIFGALTTKKNAVAPSDVTDDELLAGQARRVSVSGFENTAEFTAKRTEYCNYLMSGKTLGDVNGLDSINICDLVALNDLMPEGYDTDTTYSITGDMNTDGFITAEDTALLRAELLK